MNGINQQEDKENIYTKVIRVSQQQAFEKKLEYLRRKAERMRALRDLANEADQLMDGRTRNGKKNMK